MATSYRDPEEAVALGVRIRLARKKLGLTLLELAGRTSVSHSQISRIERGLFKGGSKNVQILCKYLRIEEERISSAEESQHLALRLERLASSSAKWRRVVAAFAEALEAAQNTPPST
ncbi:helix-turn-helix domain-containing protein [Diaphorobacter aerolatus]|uniref:Helix-turn-helix transcriptional regulator n=1 Tax=Diaphorobacter aerolatus TaxID=1288495 RepID=A0A7H0GNY1_9BURK|nr:helix-turn-helix transcriptional regulator [Diaphorobacter aerolatus]QNP49997.1 helix-turn-helix transcriptional regulator [Diaphorobacter aerolatus]